MKADLGSNSSIDIVTSTTHGNSEPSSGGRIVWELPTLPREDDGVEEKRGAIKSSPPLFQIELT